MEFVAFFVDQAIPLSDKKSASKNTGKAKAVLKKTIADYNLEHQAQEGRAPGTVCKMQTTAQLKNGMYSTQPMPIRVLYKLQFENQHHKKNSLTPFKIATYVPCCSTIHMSVGLKKPVPTESAASVAQTTFSNICQLLRTTLINFLT